MSKPGSKTEKPTPVPYVEPKTSDFEQGALFALELLKKHVELRTNHMRDLNAEFDVGGVLNGVSNVLFGLQSKFEHDLVKQLFVNRVGAGKASSSEEKPK